MLIEFKFKNGIKFLMPERFFVILDEWAFDDYYEMGYEWKSVQEFQYDPEEKMYEAKSVWRRNDGWELNAFEESIPPEEVFASIFSD